MNHRYLPAAPFDAGSQFSAAHPGHFVIADDSINLFGMKQVQRLTTISREHHIVAIAA